MNKDLFEYKDHLKDFSDVRSFLISGKPKDIEVFVSVIIPTYKRPHLLKESLASAVNQKDFSDFEILVMDNDPERETKTETWEIVESFNDPRILYYKHERNIGMFPNWNRGVELSHGKWITLLHDDDYFLPDLLKDVVKIIRKKPEIEGIKAGQITFFQKGDANLQNFLNGKKFSRSKGYWKLRKGDNLFRNSLQSPSGFFFTRENFFRLGGFDQNFFPSADYLFTTKYLLSFNIYHTKADYWICRIFENESQKVETRVKTIEQNYVLREQYGKKLGLPAFYFKGIAGYLLQRDSDALQAEGFEITNEKIQSIRRKVKFGSIFKLFFNIMLFEQFRRKGVLISELRKKSRKG